VPREGDHWSRWLLSRRDASDDRQRDRARDHLAAIRDRVLGGAEPLEGAIVLDVGTGDGLIGLAALDRVGPSGIVIFSDVSEALLARSRERVEARGTLDRARFVQARAEDLAGIADASVDVVTTRSVLMYSSAKLAALQAFRRVLRAGGRISLFEPVNRLVHPEPENRLSGYDVGEVAELAGRVKASSDAAQGPGQAAMLDFDDRDLVRLAEEAGFERVHAECHIDVEPGASLAQAVDADVLLDMAPNPLAPTLRESIESTLSAQEGERLIGHLRRAVAERRAVRRTAAAYVVAGVD
jgi:arsenite methyltransferase